MQRNVVNPSIHGFPTPALLLLGTFFLPVAASALDLDLQAPPATTSLGQPGGVDVLWGLSSGYDFELKQSASRLNAGLHAEMLLPQIGFLNATVEGGLGQVGEELDGGLSASLQFPYVNPGIEYNFLDRAPYFKLTVIGAPRRGGLLGIGDRLRLDYVPGRQLVQLGFFIQQPFETFRRNRPRNRHVRLHTVDLPEPEAVDPGLYPRDTVDRVQSAVVWMDRLLTPRFGLYDPGSRRSRRKYEDRVEPIRAHIVATRRTFVQEDSLYHAGLRAAFAAAGGDSALGDTLAREAERIILEDVVLPFDRLFGRLKKPIDLSAEIVDATRDFDRVLRGRSMTEARNAAASRVLLAVLTRIQDVARAQKRRWDDSRLLWLPLNYGLRPEQIDTQAELDAALEQVVGLPFTACNDIDYLYDNDFYYFYRNLLLHTEHYQVTVIHDFRNRSGKQPDTAAWEIVVSGYLEAFIRAVGDLDAGQRRYLPQFFLFLDEHYYRANRSRKVVTFLENLYRYPQVSLDDPGLDARLQDQVRRLEEAVTASPVLKRLGEDYLKTNLKVQINITHQFHPTFKEDAITRDHRKIAFRDVFEEDPASGEAVFTGEGIGEYYLGPSWEDRALALRGPDLVKLKTQVRLLFLTQGFEPEEVPYFLKARPLPPDYEARCRARCDAGWTTQALTTVNEVGFRSKTASVARMALYNLMPPGSVLLIPDSIWSNDYFASVFVAAALRGQEVYAISPDRAHAPSDAAPTVALIRETLAAMALGHELLAPVMKQAGGSIHVGLFDQDYDVCSARERVEAFLSADPGTHLEEGGIALTPAIRQVYREERERLASSPPAPVHVTDFGRDRKTKLHQKTQFFATREGIRILNRPEWGDFLRRNLEFLAGRCSDDGTAHGGVQPRWLQEPGDAAGSLLDVFRREEAARANGDRAAFFATVGSQNQDRRGMLLDGEALVVLSGQGSLVTLMDFVFFLTTADWLESSADVNRYFPREGGLLKTITKWIRNVI